MREDRTVTYPLDAAHRLADMFENWGLFLGQEAMEEAVNVVIDVTAAVDKLRAQDGSE